MRSMTGRGGPTHRSVRLWCSPGTPIPDSWLGEDRDGVRRDRLDLLGGALELLVGEHGGALEGEIAVELDPGAAAVVLRAHLDGDRPWDAVGAEDDHVEGMAALPGEPLLRVVGGPDVVGRQRVDGARVGDQVAGRHLGPGADPHAVGLGNAAVLHERPGRGLVVGPDALLEGASELGHVGVADAVVSLVVERGVEEEAVVLDLEMLVLLTDSALAEGEELLAFGERAHGYGPFLECDWHRREKPPRSARTFACHRGGERGRLILIKQASGFKRNFVSNRTRARNTRPRSPSRRGPRRRPWRRWSRPARRAGARCRAHGPRRCSDARP